MASPPSSTDVDHLWNVVERPIHAVDSVPINIREQWTAVDAVSEIFL